MKNLARLMIFFSVTFIILFVIFSFFRFLSSWIDSVRVINMDPEQGGVLLASARTALPVAFFLTILLSLSYSARRKIPAVFGIIVIFVFSAAFCLCFYTGIDRVEVYDPSLEVPESLKSRTGLILSRLDTSMILLADDARNAGAPRVISFPERPLVYQETPPGPGSIAVTLPLEEKTPWLIQSILIDFSLVAREFNSRYSAGLLNFLIYACSVFFLLVSFRFLFDSSSWPLANLFLGALVFRLVLGGMIFLQAGETINFLNTFVNKKIPEFLIIPAVYVILGALITLYTFLAFMARRIRRDDD